MESIVKLKKEVLIDQLSKKKMKITISEISAPHIGEHLKKTHQFIVGLLLLVVSSTIGLMAVTGASSIPIYFLGGSFVFIFLSLVCYLFSFYNLNYKLEKIKSEICEHSEATLNNLCELNDKDISLLIKSIKEKDNLNEQLEKKLHELKDLNEQHDLLIATLKSKDIELSNSKQDLKNEMKEHSITKQNLDISLRHVKEIYERLDETSQAEYLEYKQIERTKKEIFNETQTQYQEENFLDNNGGKQ